MKKILMTVAALALAGCTQPVNEAQSDLEAYGFTHVETTGWAAFACGEDDNYATKFTAINAQGQSVEGVLCKGLFFKGSTVRNLRIRMTTGR